MKEERREEKLSSRAWRKVKGYLLKADFEFSRIFHEEVFGEGVRSVAAAGHQVRDL